jgi:hypothetical protein
LCRPRLDDEEERRVEAKRAKPRSVRSPPFACGVVGKAPQDEASALGLGRRFGDCRKGEGKRGRAIAIGGRLDLVQPPFSQFGQR